LRISHLTTQLGPIFTAFSAESDLEGSVKVRSNPILRTFDCTARYLGTFPEDLAETPGAVVGALAQQLDIEPWGGFAEYGSCETKRPK
jgi:hypothetical protein